MRERGPNIVLQLKKRHGSSGMMGDNEIKKGEEHKCGGNNSPDLVKGRENVGH